MMPHRNFFIRIFLKWLRLNDSPVVKVYDGYGDFQLLIVYGHVFKLSPLPATGYTSSVLTNLFALLRLFMVRPWKNATVQLQWREQAFETAADANGFFHFEWDSLTLLDSGWHPVRVNLVSDSETLAIGEGNIFV